MKRHLLLLLTSLSVVLYNVQAQEHNPELVAKEVKLLTQAYIQAQRLSFDVRYYYANETAPAVYLDSLSGNCKISGSHYWYELDSTEMLYNDQCVIILYKEDKLMYLAKPSAQLRATNPLALLDSFLLTNNKLLYGLEIKGKEKIITIDFGKDGPCKRLQYYIDVSTGWLTKMVNVVKADQLYDPSVRAQVETGNTYAIVETRFSNYRQNSFDDTVFNTARYFTKDGDKYVATASYAMYQIFLSNPGL